MTSTPVCARITGLPRSGKSCLCNTYFSKADVRGYIYSGNLLVGGCPVTLEVLDLTWIYQSNACHYSQDSDVVLFCFDMAECESSGYDIIRFICSLPLQDRLLGTPILLIGCKSDLRNRRSANAITYSEGVELAKMWNMEGYYETSSRTGQGVSACMEAAVFAGLKSNRGHLDLPEFSNVRDYVFDKDQMFPRPPVSVPVEKPPRIKIGTSKFRNQWRQMLTDPRHGDVTFIVDGKNHVMAHKIILVCASDVLKRVILDNRGEDKESTEDATQTSETELSASSKEFKIIRVFDEVTDNKSKSMTYIELSLGITGKLFAYILQFIYTAEIFLPAALTADDIDTLVESSRVLGFPAIIEICQKRRQYGTTWKPSYVKAESSRNFKKNMKLFVNNYVLCDICFNVKGKKLWAHTAVLTARCQVMAAMLSGHYAEGNVISEIDVLDTSVEDFLVLLEYLYTDHAPLEKGDSASILVLADQYCQSRLVSICEFHISNEVKFSYKPKATVQHSGIDVISILLGAQMHNAKQLAEWCRHFICMNYDDMIKQEVFRSLNINLQNLIKERQWPPLTYEKEMYRYKRELYPCIKPCSIM